MPVSGGFRSCVGALVALLLVGCGAGHHVSGNGSEPTVEINTVPATEGPTTEAPQSDGGGGTAISIPSLPIGGNVDGDGAEQCAHVNWLGPNPIPPDVSVSLTAFGLDPEGVFRFGGTACGADRPVCTTTWRWRSSTADIECLVPVTQIVEVGSDESVTLVLAGTVQCAKQSSCDEFAGLGASQIQFTAQPGVVPTAPGESS